MEQTALRPKPMPGGEPGDGTGPGTRPGTARHPHAVRRRGRRLRAALFGLLVGTVLVLSGVGLGTVGATVIGMSKLADLRHQAQAPGGPSASAHPGPSSPTAPSSPPPAVATLGLEAVDAQKAGALVVGVHVPGPGYAAGLVRGDVLLAFGRIRIDSAADLARAVAHARPGAAITLTVRHRSGAYQQLTALPGVVT
ncbi:PDZ domain-containing protein [Streptomyces guryensis]|uniref:PDZ domain-containing protein n=1 Tax=Streptomyces guryensis TaxID=2886947 RepID=A0A9Q3Z896_9ACTN|nr:PDZ domain-containing protein [Streptomyces guryensis]MCD9873120.1 PDZ domain-containing protein [Streptomyces guryensis]